MKSIIASLDSCQFPCPEWTRATENLLKDHYAQSVTERDASDWKRLVALAVRLI